MKRLSLYRLLEFPLIYSLTQKLLAPGAKLLRKKQNKIIFGESRGLVLDVGCGPLLTTPNPNGIIIGVDINPLYIKKYSSIGVDRNTDGIKEYPAQETRLGIVCSANFLPFDDNLFDETRCVGLLHHLPTESALSSVKEMIRCTRSAGKVIVLDNVWPHVSLYRPIAWLTRRFDRGKWVRTEEELLKLTDTAYPGNWYYRRFTYSFSGLEVLLMIIEKPTQCS